MDFEDRGNRPRGGNRGPIPVREGEIYDVEIEGIGEKGDGIAKVNGYVIIVPNVKKGDRVKIRVNAVRGKVSFGEVIGEAAAASSDTDSDAGEESGDSEESGETTEDAGDSEEDSMDEGLDESEEDAGEDEETKEEK